MQQPAVTIYTSPTCGYCHMAMEYFASKGIEFTEKDITTDEEAFRFIVEKVGQAVTPIITVDDAVIVGYDRARIDEALSESKPEFKQAS